MASLDCGEAVRREPPDLDREVLPGDFAVAEMLLLEDSFGISCSLEWVASKDRETTILEGPVRR